MVVIVRNGVSKEHGTEFLKTEELSRGQDKRF